MDKFLPEFKKVLLAATEWGEKYFPIIKDNDKSFFKDQKHKKQFLSSCHRGYEKAQNRIIYLLKDINSNNSLPANEKIYRELCLRRIIDSIAYVMLNFEDHVARRLELHYEPPFIDFNILNKTKESADKLNSESRLSFALIADLSTFIHIFDLLRIDFRRGKKKISFIELKSGKVNEMLLDKLSQYDPTLSSMKRLEEDTSIDIRYLKQAKRILKQKIRVEQTEELIKKDYGIDIKTNTPMKLFGPTAEADTYDEFLNKLCDTAINIGLSFGTIHHCLHIGVGYSDNIEKSLQMANFAAVYAYKESLKEADDSLHKVRSDLLSLIDEKEFLIGQDALIANLNGMSGRPFPIWAIDREHIYSSVAKKLRIVSVFDLSGFIYLGKKMGIDLRLETRKRSEKIFQEFGGKKRVPHWGGRTLIAKTPKQELTVLGGIIQRFIVNLQTPSQFIIKWLNF